MMLVLLACAPPPVDCATMGSERVVVGTDAPTIAEAVASASEGGFVEVPAGRYAEALVLGDRAVHVCGAGDVTIDAGDLGVQAAVEIAGGAEVELAGVTIDGGGGGTGLRVTSGRLVASGTVTETAGYAIEVAEGAALLFQDGRVDDHRIAPSSDTFAGAGVAIGSGAEVTLRRVVIEDVTDSGIYIATGTAPEDAASVVLEDVEIGTIWSYHAETWGIYQGGIDDVSEGAVSLSATGVDVHGASVGIRVEGAAGAGSTIDFADVSIDDAAVDPSLVPYIGMYAGGDLVGEATALAVHGGFEVGTVLYGAELTFVDADIGPVTGAGGAYAIGIFGRYGANLTLSGGSVHDVCGTGASFSESELTVADGFTLSGTRFCEFEGEDHAAGLVVADGTATISDAVFFDNDSAGIGIIERATATLTDTTVQGTNAGVDSTASGVYAAGGSTIDATRLSVLDTQGVAVSVIEAETVVNLHTSTIDGVTAAGADSDAGLYVAAGAKALLDLDSSIRNVRGVAAWIYDATVDFNGASIEDISPYESESHAGVGVLTRGGGQAIARLLTISRVDGPGLLVDSGYVIGAACVIADTRFAGAVAVNGGAIYSDSTVIDGVTYSEIFGGGMGVFVLATESASLLQLSNIEVRDAEIASLYVDGDAPMTVESCTLPAAASRTLSTGHVANGNSVFAVGTSAWDEDEERGLLLAGNTFSGATEVAVLLEGGGAGFDGNTWTENDVDVAWQSCADTTVEPEVLPDGLSVEACPVGDDYHRYVDPGTLEFLLEYVEPDVSGVVPSTEDGA